MTLLCPIRAGQTLPLTVTAAVADGGIASVRAPDGRLVVTAAGRAFPRLEAPKPFAPAVSRFDPARALFSVKGTASRVEELPVKITTATQLTVSCRSWANGGDLEISGAAALELDAGCYNAGWRLESADPAASAMHPVAGLVVRLPGPGVVRVVAPNTAR